MGAQFSALRMLGGVRCAEFCLGLGLRTPKMSGSGR
jgi:hypothetical protein